MAGLIKTKIAGVLAVSLLLAAGPMSANSPERHVYRLDCGLTAGSAVKIGEDTYVTAKHVVDGFPCFLGDAPLKELVSEDKDFSMFKGPASDDYIKVSCRGFRAKEEYLATGYAGGAFESVSLPWIARNTKGVYTTFVGEAIPGMSGGSVIDSRGKLVGIVNMRWPARSLPMSKTPACKGK